MNTNQVSVEQIVTFAVLMENNQGIIGKAPSYIKEKFSECMQTTNPWLLKAILDSENRAKFEAWRQRWTLKK